MQMQISRQYKSTKTVVQAYKTEYIIDTKNTNKIQKANMPV